MQSIRCIDRAVRFNSHTKIKTLKTENNSEIINPLFDGLSSNKDGNVAHCSYFSSPLQGSKKLLRTSHKVHFLFSEGTVTNPVL